MKIENSPIKKYGQSPKSSAYNSPIYSGRKDKGKPLDKFNKKIKRTRSPNDPRNNHYLKFEGRTIKREICDN
jgi:hypothetical protein